MSLDASSVYEKYESLLEKSKSDPEGEPYKSKYEAQSFLEKFLEISRALALNLDNASSQSAHTLLLESALLLLLGKLAVDTDERTRGETLLHESLAKASAIPDLNKTLILKISILNQLGAIQSDFSNNDRAKDLLVESTSLYGNSSEVKNCVWSVKDIFYSKVLDQKKSSLELEHEQTLTLYFLAQVHKILGNYSESAKHCSVTLRRQLEEGVGDAVDWALNAATLSQYFASRNLFREARHHLAAASWMIGQVAKKVEENNEELERYRYRLADIQRCWAKYDLLIIDYSWELIQKIPTEEPELDFSCPRFPSEEISVFEDIPCETARTFEEARVYFLHGQKMLNASKTYYAPDEKASDYFEIVQEHSHLFRSLASFELDNERQCRMHKRRIDMLEETLKDMNKKVYLEIARQILFELGETYSTLFNLKLEKIDSMKKAKHEGALAAMVKANQIAEKGVVTFKEFQTLYKDKNGKLPTELAEDDIRPVLLSQFYLGRFVGKFHTSDSKQLLQNTKLAVEHFEFIINYCANSKVAKDLLTEELAVCTEMVELLNLKIQRLVSAL